MKNHMNIIKSYGIAVHSARSQPHNHTHYRGTVSVRGRQACQNSVPRVITGVGVAGTPTNGNLVHGTTDRRT